MRMSIAPLAAICCMLLLAVGPAYAQSGLPMEVITLTDANFEHDTQASTGQTTGHWCIVFTSKIYRHYPSVRAMWELLASDENKEVIYAEVDVEANPILGERWSGLDPLPKAVLLRDQQMYIYEVPLEALDGHEDIMGFVAEGYTLMRALRVPPEGFQDRGMPDLLPEFSVKCIVIGGLLMGLVLVLALACGGDRDEPTRMPKAPKTKAALKPKSTSGTQTTVTSGDEVEVEEEEKTATKEEVKAKEVKTEEKEAEKEEEMKVEKEKMKKVEKEEVKKVEKEKVEKVEKEEVKKVEKEEVKRVEKEEVKKVEKEEVKEVKKEEVKKVENVKKADKKEEREEEEEEEVPVSTRRKKSARM